MSKKLLLLALVTGLLTMSAVARADTLLEKIATTVLADKFGIDTREVTILRQQTRLPVYELAPIYEGAYHFKQRPTTVWKLREQGMGWGQIAKTIGMHPGTFNKLRNQGAFDRDRFWTTSYQDRFDVPTQQVQVVRKAGGSLEDVLGAIIIGKLTKQSPSRVYDQFKTQGSSWTTVATRSNVRFEQWQRVSAPVRNRYNIGDHDSTIKPKSNQGVRDHGKGIGKGKSQGKNNVSHGKVKLKDKGKNPVKGKGKEKGKGKSGGKGKGG